jgi:hypothetical protein
MNILVSKDALKRMALCVCFLTALPIAQAAEPITISMTAEHWQTKENAEFLRQLGFYHGLMRLNSGDAALKDITFSDGTIEFDVNTIGRGAPGIAFRQQDEGNFELLYFRPDPSCPAFQACMQYAPQTHGVLLWDLFPQYQTRAPLRDNGWNHIKMVVSGRRMNVFVNDALSPTLQVTSLEGDTTKGGLRLQGPGTFANMVITPDAVEGLAPQPASDPRDGDRGLVRNWHLSSFSVLPNGKNPEYNEMPAASQEWKTIRTERNGLVNLSRVYGRPLPEPNRAVAWLKTTISSDRKQTKRVDIGWTRELWVFVNGQLVYADKNLFEVEDARKAPDARCSLENGSFPLPLEAGDNEVAVAIANNFFGWGMMLRLADPDGLHLAENDKPVGWQQMVEDASRTHGSCDVGMDDSRLSVCLAGSLFRQRPASRSAFISDAMVVLGNPHTSDSLGGPEDPYFQQAVCATNPGTFTSEPAGDGCVRSPFGGTPRRLWNW